MSIKHLVSLCGLLFCSGVFAQVLPNSVVDQLDRQLIENAERYAVVSQAVNIFKNDQLIYQGIHGSAHVPLAVPAKTSHIYPAFSLAKLFTSVVLMQQVEKGRIDLDRSIVEYLPKLPKSWRDVTVRHCLNHSSGLPEYFSPELLKQGFLSDFSAVIADLKDQPMQFATGASNRYNNTNFLVLGAILEQQTGQSLLSLLDKSIIKPLLLKNTGYSSAGQLVSGMVASYWGDNGGWRTDAGIKWPEYSYAHVGLYSTLDDLATFMKAVTNGDLLTAKTVKKMWRPIKLNNGQAGEYAAGWQFGAGKGFFSVGHEGGDRVRLRHYVFTDDSYTVVYLTNGNGRNVWTSLLVEGLMAIIAPSQFSLAVTNAKMIDLVMANASEAQLDKSFAKLSQQAAVIKYRPQRMVMMLGYAMYYGAGIDKALPFFALNTRQFPQSPNAWQRLASHLEEKGDTEQAIKAYQKALALDGNMSFSAQRLQILNPSR